MRVEIRDREALSSLPLSSLRSYLRSHGWTDDGPWGGGRATMYLKEHEGHTWDILVPMRDTVADYARSMAEAVDALAAVERRSQLDVYNDLMGTGADTILLRSANGMGKGSLSLRQSANLLNDAYDMLASVARAVEKPQSTYRGRISADVTDYLDSVQPFTDYHEGYVLTLRSPVPAGFGIQEDFFGNILEAPFSRLATMKLAEALEHSMSAISDAVTEDTLDPFQQAVSHGVSANLCDSVSALAEKGHGIVIDLSWADIRPSNIADSQFQFSEHSARVLAEAAANFRRNEPFLDESIIAHVVRLEREPKEFDGRAIILYVRDGRPLRMRVEFEQSTYNTVIQAFQERNPLSMDGDIYRVGNGYELRRPHNLSIIPE